MKAHVGLAGMLAALLAGCSQMTVHETVLSTNQRLVMVSSPGDGISPPTNVVLLEETPGRLSPVATGFGTAPVPALLTGAVAGIAVGAGIGLSADSITQNCPGALSNTVGGSVGGPGGINDGIGSASGGSAASSGSAALCNVN